MLSFCLTGVVRPVVVHVDVLSVVRLEADPKTGSETRDVDQLPRGDVVAPWNSASSHAWAFVSVTLSVTVAMVRVTLPLVVVFHTSMGSER